MSAVTFGSPALPINGNRSQDWDGYLAWTDEPGLVTGFYQPPSGFLFAGKARATRAAASGATLSAKLRVQTAGAGLTGVYVAIYRASDNAQLAVSVDQSVTFNAATGTVSVPLPVAVSIGLGDYIYLSILCVGTTTPNFNDHVGSVAINIVSTYRGYATGLTTPPATLPTLNVNDRSIWMAIL